MKSKIFKIVQRLQLTGIPRIHRALSNMGIHVKHSTIKHMLDEMVASGIVMRISEGMPFYPVYVPMELAKELGWSD